MSLNVLPQLTWLALQVSLYYAAITWLAWTWQQRRKEDAFHLVVALTFSFGAWHLLETFHVPSLMLVVLTIPIAWSIAELALPLTRTDKDGNLLILLVAATTSIIAFDWMTSHQPLSIKGNAVMHRYLAVTSAVILCLVLIFVRSGGYVLVLCAGRDNSWAFDYWGRSQSKPRWLYASFLLCWITILNYPLSTTGVLSLTILRDVSLSVLFAKVISYREPLVLLSLCATFGFLRTFAGFLFVGGVGPAIVDMTAGFASLIWLHHHSVRTTWNGNDRRMDHSPLD
jgi:hypothetical protein